MYTIRQVPVQKSEVLHLLYFHSTFVPLPSWTFTENTVEVTDIDVPQLCLPTRALCWLAERVLSLSCPCK